MSNAQTAANVETQAQEVAAVPTLAQMIEALQSIDVEDKQQLHMKNIAMQLNSVIGVLKAMQVPADNGAAARDRGPKSDRDMTEEDARRVMLGDLKDASHKTAAETLGLSYGQVYSARKGFTFKTIGKEAEAAAKAAKA